MPPKRRLLLSDALDSKRIRLEAYSSKDAQPVYLRLRLEVLLQILFGGQVLVCEGWALDSLPFIRVANEVIMAKRRLEARSDCPDGLQDFHPFVMEVRERGNYIDTFMRYMARSDVRWSGYTPLQHQEKKRAVYAALRKNHSRQPLASGDALVSPMIEVLGREDVPEALGNVASYFDARPQERILYTVLSKHAFSMHLLDLFSCLNSRKLDSEVQEIAAPLIRFEKDVRRLDLDLTNSSIAMHLAEQSLDRSSADAVFHLINYSYMRVRSDAANADLLAPSMGITSTPILRLANTLLPLTFDEHTKSGELDFGHSLDASANEDCEWKPKFGHSLHVEHRLTESLISSNWAPIWESAIRLSLDPRWHKAIKELRREAQSGLGTQHLMNTAAFQKMTDLLENECPELTLRESGAERLGLTLSAKWLKGFDELSERVILFLVGFGLAQIIVPGFAIATGVGLTAASDVVKPFLPEIKRLGMNPFSRQGIWSSRSTIFHIMR